MKLEKCVYAFWAVFIENISCPCFCQPDTLDPETYSTLSTLVITLSFLRAFIHLFNYARGAICMYLVTHTCIYFLLYSFFPSCDSVRFDNGNILISLNLEKGEPCRSNKCWKWSYTSVGRTGGSSLGFIHTFKHSIHHLYLFYPNSLHQFFRS